MFARSSRLFSLSMATLLALPGMTWAQTPPSPPAAAEGVGATARSADPDEAPAAGFDLNRALVSESGGLTADRVARLARGRSPEVAGAQAAADSAKWDAKAQWVNFLPTLSVFGQYKRISKVDNEVAFFSPPTAEQINQLSPETLVVLQDFSNVLFAEGGGTSFTQPLDNWSAGATLRVPASEIFLGIWPAYESSLKVAEARDLQIEAKQAEVDLRAREAFYGYARAVAFRAVAEQAFAQADAQAGQIQLFVNAGTAAPVDLMAATARREGARGSLSRAQGSVAVTRTVLATMTGLRPDEIAAIGEPVTELPPAPSQTADELVARAIEQRAELRALRKVAGANDLLQSAEKNAAWPRLVLEGNTLLARPNPRYIPPVEAWRGSWDVSATLVWTPNQALSGHARGRRAEADLEKARADIVTLQDAVRIEVVRAYEDYKSADAAARAAESELKAAEEAYRVRLAMFRVGAGVVVDLLDADFLVTQARLSHISSVLDARTALARLDRAAVRPR